MTDKSWSGLSILQVLTENILEDQMELINYEAVLVIMRLCISNLALVMRHAKLIPSTQL
jgi:hypothetical protein